MNRYHVTAEVLADARTVFDHQHSEALSASDDFYVDVAEGAEPIDVAERVIDERYPHATSVYYHFFRLQ